MTKKEYKSREWSVLFFRANGSIFRKKNLVGISAIKLSLNFVLKPSVFVKTHVVRVILSAYFFIERKYSWWASSSSRDNLNKLIWFMFDNWFSKFVYRFVESLIEIHWLSQFQMFFCNLISYCLLFSGFALLNWFCCEVWKSNAPSLNSKYLRLLIPLIPWFQ